MRSAARQYRLHVHLHLRSTQFAKTLVEQRTSKGATRPFAAEQRIAELTTFRPPVLTQSFAGLVTQQSRSQVLLQAAAAANCEIAIHHNSTSQMNRFWTSIERLERGETATQIVCAAAHPADRLARESRERLRFGKNVRSSPRNGIVSRWLERMALLRETEGRADRTTALCPSLTGARPQMVAPRAGHGTALMRFASAAPASASPVPARAKGRYGRTEISLDAASGGGLSHDVAAHRERVERDVLSSPAVVVARGRASSVEPASARSSNTLFASMEASAHPPSPSRASNLPNDLMQRLTEQIVRELDHRAMASRERMGGF